MAVRASELLLIIRAQNQASSALRRLGSDLQTLGKGSTLKRAQQQLAINEQNLLRQRMAAQRQLDSITQSSGVRNIANQQRLANIERSKQTLITRSIALQDRGNRLAIARATAEDRIRSLQASQTANLAKQQAQMQRLAASEVEFMAAQERAKSVTWASGPNKGRIGTPVLAEQQAYAENAYRIQKARLAELVAMQEKYGSSLARVQQRLAGFGVREQIVARNSKALTVAQNDLAISAGKVDAMWEKEQAIAGELSAELTVVAQRLAVVKNEQRALAEEMRAARWTPLITLGSIMEHTARVATQSGLVIGATFAYAAHSAAQFQTQAALAATQVADKFGKGARGTVTATKQISDGILGIMKAGQAFAGSKEQNAAAYDIFSSMTLKGTQANEIKQGMSLLKQFNQAAIAGQADLESVTHAGITILNDFGKVGKQSQQLPQFLNRMFAAVRYGRMTVDEFTSSLGQLAPAFAGAYGHSKYAFDQLSSAMATITRFNPKLGMSSAGLSRMMEILQRPDFVKGFQTLYGKDISNGAGHLRPLEEVFRMIDKAVPKLKQGGLLLNTFFKTVTAAGSTTGKGGTNATVQARRTLQALITNIGQFHDVSKSVIKDNNEFWKSFRTEQATPAVKWKEFTEQLRALVIEIGSYAIPAFVKLGEPIVKLLKWFDNLSESTKKQIAQWGTYSAAILLVGGAVLFFVGAALKLVGTFGRMRVLGPVVIASFIAFNVVVGLLKGNIHSLGDVVTSVLNSLTPHSSWGWVAYLSVAALAANRLAKGFMAVRDAYIATTAISSAGVAAGGIGGAAGSLVNFARTASALRAARLEAGAGKLSATFGGVAAAAGGLSVAIPVIAGGVALAAGAAFLWEKHMQGVRREAEKLAKEQAYITTLANAPKVAAQPLGSLAGDTENVFRARKAVDAINKQIAAARKGHAGKDVLQGLYFDRADALNALDAANLKANRSFDALSASIEKQGGSLRKLASESARIKALRAEQAKLQDQMDQPGHARGINLKLALQYKAIGEEIKRARAYMSDLIQGTRAGTTTLASEFTKTINSMSRQRVIPKIDTTQMQDLFKFALSKQRMLTIPEIKAFIKAEVDPKSLRSATAAIRKAITGDRSVRKIQAQFKYDFKATQQEKALEKGLKIKTTVTKPSNTSAVHKTIADVFQKTIKQRIIIDPNAGKAFQRATAIGRNIALGAAAGVNAEAKAVADAAVAMSVNAVAAGKAAIKSKSPSRLAAEQIGKPFGQGVAQGILSSTDLVVNAVKFQVNSVMAYIKSQNIASKTQALSMNLFGGAFLTNRVNAIDNFDPQVAKQKLAEANSLAAQIRKMEAKLGSTGASKFTVGRPVGLVQRGNIDLNARPIVHNKDGTVSTVKSVSFGTNKGETLIPEVVGNKVVSAMEAWKHYLKTGQNLGTFKTVKDANAYAESLHNEQAAYAKTTTAAKNYAKSRIEVDKLREAADRRAAVKPQPLSMKDLIRDTQLTAKSYRDFNRDINALAKAGLPPKMLDDLRAMGIDGKKYLDLMYESLKKHPKALKELVAAWKEEEKQVNKSTYVTLADLKNMSAGMKAQLKSMAGDAAHTLLDTWNGFHSQMQSAFGDLFGGPDNLSNMIGDNLKSAQDQYTTDAQALTDQIAADNKQLADLTKQNTQQAIDQMTQSFGQLFSGDWMQSTQVQTLKQFGQKLGFDDLFKDLKSQTTKFERWQSDLKSLAKKLPPGLEQALKDLGPDAVDQLDTLNGATKEQLKQYIALWQKGQKDIGTAAKGLLNSGDFKSQTASILADLKSVTDQLNKLVVPHALTPADVIDDLQKQSDAFSNYQDTIKQLQAKGLPDQLIQQLQALGPQGLEYLKALNNMTSNQLSHYVDIWTKAQGQITDATNTMFQTQLQMWEQYGSNIASAIIAGIASDQQALIDYFTHLFLDILNGRTPTPPPNTSSGGSSGQDNSDPGNQRGHRAPTGSRNGSLVSGGNSTVINQTVHAHQSEDLLSMLSKANFRITTILPNNS